MNDKTAYELTALAPTDGRYASITDALRPYFSEFGLIRYRVFVEIRWLLFLAQQDEIEECQPLPAKHMDALTSLMTDFSMEHAVQVKTIEETTNHDVKAVEYFLRDYLDGVDEPIRQSDFIHFACTSEDINNLAYALALHDARNDVLLPLLDKLYQELDDMSIQYCELAMLSRTHGQTASPTTMGKEIQNVASRLVRQIQALRDVSILGKMNGAVGNYNAHHIAYPTLDWPTLGRAFVRSLNLTPNTHTTQIEPHDWMAELFQTLIRINIILLDWCRDVWGYISLGYFSQIAVAGEVGSSTMPHKINPIQFENGEGNLGLANAALNHLSQKLPISRWQRDLTDSTVQRNIGVALGWSLIAYTSIAKGMSRMTVNERRLQQDLVAAWEVLAEPIQTVMKRYGIGDAYEQLKALTRGHEISELQLAEFIAELPIPEEARNVLAALRPDNYVGFAKSLAKQNPKSHD